ncbi:Bis(5'-nucleosyl)-tetraphosphatase, symmetrical [Aliiroseovarius pelagivivens]|uniref:Bis(5'-nucleosyl)-tetraphosphatase, symmetrical n=1 Tax=Aliiroseovarius pelagivivens TaxID=1639690 RepID=A0A2R8AS26_9RHOB|nr:metallophosphoesterase [Aliiroseovarius pelagivivens]SPF78868.1 Bis(5'-nucleosyl)-tetraphosphatase, symmetrical [Aliiroseovarius pelagivivens]
MSEPIYAIGDVHGQLGMLEHTLDLIEKDGGPQARIVFLGDYVDRGAHSKGVVTLLLEGLNRGRNWICLLGNHDRMFSMFMEEYPRHDEQFLVGYHWFDKRIGGIETMSSYGVGVAENDRLYQIHAAAQQRVPYQHVEFLRALRPYHQQGDYLFVHAGIRPGILLEEQTVDDLIWIRGDFLNDKRAHPWIVVHGHTPVDGDVAHYGNRINVDTGAGNGRKLSAVVLENGKSWILDDRGRTELNPSATLV